MAETGRYAAIDVGTVTCRLLVADVDASGSLRELSRMLAIANLGEGVDASRVLRQDAMERVARAVAGFKAEIDRLSLEKPVSTTCIATSAARDAENADELAALLAREGVELSVIPGEREATLSFRGASRGFEGERIEVVDVGGGSTEIVAGLAGDAPSDSRSFDIGCRRVTEKFLASDPPSPLELKRARAWMCDEMRSYFNRLRADGFGAARIVAVAGTATSVVSIRESMETYDPSLVDGAFVSTADLDAVYRRLAAMTCEERTGVVGLDPGRAPVIVAGLLILRTVVGLVGAPGFTVSESDILHGTILDAAEAIRERGGIGRRS